jgi:hypothetical protein
MAWQPSIRENIGRIWFCSFEQQPQFGYGNAILMDGCCGAVVPPISSKRGDFNKNEDSSASQEDDSNSSQTCRNTPRNHA